MLMGIQDCFAIMASLCINQSANAELVSSVNISGAWIKIGEVSVESITRSDSIVMPVVRMMRETCSGGICVYYRGHCGTSEGQRTCTLWYTPEPSEPLRKIKIFGTVHEVAEVMESVMVIGKGEFSTRLSDFDYSAQSDFPPICPARTSCPSN